MPTPNPGADRNLLFAVLALQNDLVAKDSLLEAMSASAVVAASAVSSLPDVIGDGITFDPYCTEAICHAMLQALEMTAVEAADYRRRCRARADALFKSFGQMPPIP